MLYYLIRLDDASPRMNWKKWNTIFNILDKYNIKPIVAVIPNNEDEQLDIDKYNPSFWDIVRLWENKGYHIAMHGFNHKYISSDGGLIPINKQSEFAGVHIDIQREKIKKSWSIFKKNKIFPKIWVAPAHTFDFNTLTVLKEETNIEIISDGIAYYPYKEYGFLWIPQQLWWYKEKKEGIWTICLHPNNMSENDMMEFENFIKYNQKKFMISIEDLYRLYKTRDKSFRDYLFFYMFFMRIKLSKIKSSFIQFYKRKH